MQTITHVLEEKRDGTKLVKNFFLYPNEGSILKRAQSYFTASEKKQSRLNDKLSLKSNPIKYKEDRVVLAQHLLKSDSPNWNIKFGFL